jgi:hypothetical protein
MRGVQSAFVDSAITDDVDKNTPRSRRRKRFSVEDDTGNDDLSDELRLVDGAGAAEKNHRGGLSPEIGKIASMSSPARLA